MTTLHGLRILNTRPKHQSAELSRTIHALGGIAIELPTLIIQATEKTWWTTLKNHTHIDQAIFISQNAVDCFFEGLPKRLYPTQTQIIAIGESTAQALHKHHITVHHRPTIANSEHLLDLPILQHIKGQTILLIKGEHGRPLIEQTLTQRGATLIPLVVYQRLCPEKNKEFTDTLWHTNSVDIILLTSEQSLHQLFLLFDDSAQAWLKQKRWVVISERLAHLAASHGIKHIIISSYHDLMTTLKGLVE